MSPINTPLPPLLGGSYLLPPRQACRGQVLLGWSFFFPLLRGGYLLPPRQAYRGQALLGESFNFPLLSGSYYFPLLGRSFLFTFLVRSFNSTFLGRRFNFPSLGETFKSLWVFAVLLLAFEISEGNAQRSDRFDINGYFQGMPVRIAVDLPEPFGEEVFWEYRIQNRLNFSWYASSNITMNAQMRTRFFAGDLVKEIPGYASAIDRDDGWMNLSWLMIEEENWLLHFIPDRLNFEWNQNDWRVTLGRQRINWGINTVSNPNDLFNIYSYYDFDYPERPGSDAIRVQHFLDWSTRIELAFSPASNLRESVGAFMYATNSRGYDFQLIGGYYKERLAMGGGWAGSIRESGFKGEVMVFTDLNEAANSPGTNFVIGISGDHMFDNSIFLIVEGFYNHAGGREDFLLFGSSLSADNPSFSRYQLMTQASYPFSPIWNGSFAAIWYPDEEALFLSPSVSYSLHQNIDVNLLTQIFIGSNDSVFGSAGSVAMASVKWNF
jgi:hypothetical protein